MNINTLHAIQMREFEILDEIERICHKYDIPFILIGGTCLGAVRHNGIIPWDDDIDIGMLRKDYEKFKKVCLEELDNRYYFQDMFTEENCSLVFGKVRDHNSLIIEEYSKNVNIKKGIWVDIFPFDKVPNNDKIIWKEYKKISFLKSLLNVKCGYKLNNKGVDIIKYYLARFITLFLSKNKLKKKIYKELTKYNILKCDYSYLPYGGNHGLKELIRDDMFKNRVLHQFEEKAYPIVSEYDKYLTQMYGNYMMYPPLEQRVSIHGVLEIIIDNKKYEIL